MIFDCFGIGFGAVLASQVTSKRGRFTRQIWPVRLQDCPKIVLGRFFFRFVVRDRFFGRLGVVLGSFLDALGVVLVLFRQFNSSIQPVNSSIRVVDSTHQLLNLSTHHPMALRHFLTRPGGLRAARLNNPMNISIQKLITNSFVEVF